MHELLRQMSKQKPKRKDEIGTLSDGEKVCFITD